jgi:prolyl 4-hydroxylase
MVSTPLTRLALLALSSLLLAEAALTSKWLARTDHSIVARGQFRLARHRVHGCDEDEGVLLCQALPELGDGSCDSAGLQRILATVNHQGWHGDKAQVIRTESPSGWLPVPALQPSNKQVGAPTSSWQTLHHQGLFAMDDFLSAKEADAILAQVQNYATISSEVVQPTLPTCGFRRSTTWVFFGQQREQAPLPHDLLARIEGATHISRDHYEATQVVKYKPGDFFSDHYDSSPCDHIGDHKIEGLENIKLRDSLSCDDSARRQGTLIVYLTDEKDGEGGATYFPKLDVRVMPKRGRAIFFRPTRPDGSNDPWMLHSAETMQSGEKYLLQQWIMHGTGWR